MALANPLDKRLNRRLAGKDGGPLLRWYRLSKRDLPWRETNDPYSIWVSEIMLQQTQVKTVLPYYERWMLRFPSVAALAEAEEQEVLSQWQGLGYYRRCRNLLKGARWVAEHGMPGCYHEWLKVPGVGPYTAAAISSIALGEPVAVVDGNVERVYARITGDRSSGPALHRAAWDWAGRQLFKAEPAEWNQAMMELGATVCRPVNPCCSSCPLEAACVARQSWQVHELPVREPKRPVVRLRFSVYVPVFEGRFGLRQIPSGEWWEGMWEFPRFALRSESSFLTDCGWCEDLGHIRHTVTHHRIQLDAALLRCETEPPGLRWFTAEELEALPLPAPMRRVFERVS